MIGHAKLHELAASERFDIFCRQIEPFTVTTLSLEPFVPIGLNPSRIVGLDHVKRSMIAVARLLFPPNRPNDVWLGKVGSILDWRRTSPSNGKWPNFLIRAIYFSRSASGVHAISISFGEKPASLSASPHRSQSSGYQSLFFIPVSLLNRRMPGDLPPFAFATRLISLRMCCLSIAIATTP